MWCRGDEGAHTGRQGSRSQRGGDPAVIQHGRHDYRGLLSQAQHNLMHGQDGQVDIRGGRYEGQGWARTALDVFWKQRESCMDEGCPLHVSITNPGQTTPLATSSVA